MKKITLLLSLLFCIIGIGKTFAASPITSVTGTTKITAATALDVTKVYMIFSSDRMLLKALGMPPIILILKRKALRCPESWRSETP